MKLATAISLLLLILLISPFLLGIKDVVCTSQFGKCSPQIELATDKLIGVTYKSLDREIDKNEVLKNEVEQFSYFFIPPATLNIQVIEKKGEVAFKNINKPEYFIVTTDLNIVNKLEQTQLPVVYTEIEEFEKHPNFGYINQLMTSLSRYYSIREGIWSKNSFTIVYNGNTEIIFPTSGDIDVVLGAMEVMLFQLNQGLQNSKINDVRAEDIRLIDLRYKNPIIK